MALCRHYSVTHGNGNKPALHEAYTVTFVEKPGFHSRDTCENKWYHKLNATMSIQSMIVPHAK